MIARFAAIEARISRAVQAHLANATAVLAGQSFAVVFDAAYADPLGIAGTAPRAQCVSADVSTATFGTPITVNGAAYTVREKQPDGTGMTVLLLEAA